MFAVMDGLVVVAELGVIPAQCVEGVGLSASVAAGVVKVGGVACVVEGGPVVAAAGTGAGEAVVGWTVPALVDTVISCPVHREIRNGFDTP